MLMLMKRRERQCVEALTSSKGAAGAKALEKERSTVCTGTDRSSM